jgi:hypothetical protein
LACVLLALLAGCGRGAADAAGDSDANGYWCRKCNLKFYTAREVFAEHCPKCKGYDIPPVVGYVCDKDGHITVTPRGPSVRCEKCRVPLTAIKLPRENELKAWGAAKKTKAEVCGN